MLSLQQIQHDKFYIDCGDNATLRECVKLLPYNPHWTQMLSLFDKGIASNNTIIAILYNKEYFTVIADVIDANAVIYQYSQISEFAHLQISTK